MQTTKMSRRLLWLTSFGIMWLPNRKRWKKEKMAEPERCRCRWFGAQKSNFSKGAQGSARWTAGPAKLCPRWHSHSHSSKQVKEPRREEGSERSLQKSFHVPLLTCVTSSDINRGAGKNPRKIWFIFRILPENWPPSLKFFSICVFSIQNYDTHPYFFHVLLFISKI